MPAPPDTIVALATPPGSSALAVLRLSGPLCLQMVTTALQRPSPTPRRATRAIYRDLSGQCLDHLLFLFFPAPHSYTGEDLLELHPHGNPWLVNLLLRDLQARGARLAEPGEFTRRAFLNGKMDLTQAEAVADLIQARTGAALEAAGRQLAGSLGREIQSLSEDLIRLVAAVEAYLDFPEEDLPPEESLATRQELELLAQRMNRLAATADYTHLLQEGVRVVLAGPPNAGKSSLLNALLGRERALVSAEPGTTRDYLEETLPVGPYLLRLVDTAGLRPAASDLEERGMARSREQLATADLHLLVLDGSVPAPAALLPEGLDFHPGRLLILENKCDLPEWRTARDLFPEAPHLPISARTGAGLDGLRSSLLALLDAGSGRPPPEAVLVSARHAAALARAGAALGEARDRLSARAPLELAAADLRQALAACGEILGRIDHERVLDALFARFCIGK